MANFLIGVDSSGNGNHWTAVNLDETDTVADSPTDNFATLNPLMYRHSVGVATFEDGNLTVSTTNSSSSLFNYGSIAINSGQWYWEVTCNVYPSSIVDAASVGIDDGARVNDDFTGASYGITGSNFAVNDVIGIALDCDANELKIYKNNSLYSTTSIADTTYFPFITVFHNSKFTANFGQQPFKYDPPA